METVVVIERKTFEEIMARFNRLVAEVCRILQVSPRTLQTLRSNGTLGYSQIVRKVYYRAEDVQRIIPVVEERRRRAALKGKSI